MEIKARLYGALRDFLPRESRGRTVVTLEQGATVSDLLSALNMQGRPAIVAVNELHEADMDHPLEDGDQVSIFAPAAGG